MNEDVLIQAEHVSKKFCRSLRRSLWYGVQGVLHSLNPFSPGHAAGDVNSATDDVQLRADEFWSLRDVCFQVRRGECLGLIGHNGAGKSTLLKILNGAIRPDRGRVTMRGRVAAMIELNAGFNSLLTGRENIYNQGALLGFSKAEMDRRFDAIVDFSELEQFIDTPVQNYSSGMKVKLGFSVFTQLDPDILLIDEVLAVGDIGFRFKCLNRISEILRNSAVIFVSHSMTQVMRVCSQVLMLKEGRVAFHGNDVTKGLESYYALFGGGSPTEAGSLELQVDAVQVAAADGGCCELGGQVSVRHREELKIRLSVLRRNSSIKNTVVQVLFWNQEMIPVLDVMGQDDYGQLVELAGHRTELELTLPPLPLNSGRFSVSIILTAPGLQQVYCQLDQAVKLLVTGGSPASGAGCVMSGDWCRISNRLSLPTRCLLDRRRVSGEKLSAADTVLFDELSEGDVAIDCGANVGVITREMALRGAVVHAFEPDPVAFAELQKNVSGFAGVNLHQLAVAAAPGKMPLFFREERSQNEVLYSVGSTLLAGKTDVCKENFCEVQVVRLADFIRQFPRIRLLKMDIEGAECEVLEDLIREGLLDRCDLVLVETHEEWIPETIPRLQRIQQQLLENRYHQVHLNWI